MHGSSHICPMCRCTGCIFMHAIWTSALTPWGFPHAAVQNNSNKTPAALYALTRSACMHKSWEIDFQLKVCCKGWDWSAWSSQAVPWLTVTPPISRKNAQRAHRSQLLHMVKISYVQKLNGPMQCTQMIHFDLPHSTCHQHAYMPTSTGPCLHTCCNWSGPHLR